MNIICFTVRPYLISNRQETGVTDLDGYSEIYMDVLWFCAQGLVTTYFSSKKFDLPYTIIIPLGMGFVTKCKIFNKSLRILKKGRFNKYLFIR